VTASPPDTGAEEWSLDLRGPASEREGLPRISPAADADQIATGIEPLAKLPAEGQITRTDRTASTTEERK
jgi:hypothetical protein